jgi:flagellar basal-body rod modification protein FlgD
MTTPISGNGGTTPVSGSLGTPSTVAANKKNNAGKSELDKDAFLRLLVAQMKYQDPNKPADASAFMAQTATFTQVEKLEDLLSAQQSQLMLGASGLIGKTITFTGADGTEVSGVVSSATISGSSPTLRVGDTDVPLSSVKEVRNTAG